MEYRNLGRTGVKVSPLCLGTMMFGKQTAEPDAMDMIDQALDAGINFIDTANVYHRGLSEQAVGHALARNGKRDRVVLATKVFARMADDDPNMQGNHRRHIIEQCDASLRRLKTDWIDLYQIHRPMSEIPIDETLRALDDLVRAGKIRYAGTSTFAAWQLMEALWVSKEYRLNRFVTEQPPYNLLDRRAERELVPMAQTYGIALLPWSPLAGGFLTGKYRRDDRDDVVGRHTRGRFYGEHFTDRTFDVVDCLVAIAEEKGCTPSQLALAWCASQPGIASAIMGPRTAEQLQDNLGALEVEIMPDDRARLDAVTVPGGAVLPNYYNADFGPHQYRW